MKRILAFVVLSSFIMFNVLGAKGAEPNIVDLANAWLKSNNINEDDYFSEWNSNKKQRNTNQYISGTRDTIVYDKPFGNTIKVNGGERNRYLGYTMMDAKFTNYMYPDDTNKATSYFSRGYNLLSLVKEPWNDPATRQHFTVVSTDGVSADKKFCNKPEFEPYIKEGLRRRSRATMKSEGIPVTYATVDFTKEQIDSVNWIEYTYVIQPPTAHSWGSGVIFRNNGGIGYLTIPIPPNVATPSPSPTISPSPSISPVIPKPTPPQPVEGVLTSEKDANGKFIYDANTHIPSSVNIVADITSGTNQFYFDGKLDEKAGSTTYKVKIKKDYKSSSTKDKTDKDGNVLKDENGVTLTESTTNTTTVEQIFDVTRDFKYYEVGTFKVYQLQQAEITNEIFNYDKHPNKTWIINAKNTPVPVEIKKTAKLVPPSIESGCTVVKGDKGENVYEYSLTAEWASIPDDAKNGWDKIADGKIGKYTVANDGIKVGENVVLDSTEDTATAPKKKDIENKLLEVKATTQIKSDLANGTYASTGELVYTDELGIRKTKTIAINSVGVFTPTVCYPKYINPEFNQSIQNEPNALVLGRPFKIGFSSIGQHQNWLGYGARDYKNFTKMKQIQFPFDVYYKGNFVKRGAWTTIPLDEVEPVFTLPTWVTEKTDSSYKIHFREYAINQKMDVSGIKFNGLQNQYVATDELPVNVIGRLYGLKVYDITDYPNWEKAFRKTAGGTESTGNSFVVGKNNMDGVQIRKGNTFFPVRGNANPYANFEALKSGYRFKFNLTTVGKYYGDTDCVRIKPSFYWVSDLAGNGQVPVDIYYNERFGDKNNNLVKIGDERDKQNLKYIKLGDPYRSVPNDEWEKTASVIATEKGQTKENVMTQIKNSTSKLGWLSDIILVKGLRTFVGEQNNIPADAGNQGDDKFKGALASIRSVQRWYGEYYLPNDMFVCLKDTDVMNLGRQAGGITRDNSFWKKDGYVVVNFEIETVKGGDFSRPALTYWDEGTTFTNNDMWDVERGKDVFSEAGKGDMMYYFPAKRSTDDLK